MTRVVLAAGSSLAVLAMLTACGDRGETPAAETPPAEAVEEAQAETPAPADIGLPGASASPAERNLAEAEAFLDRNSQRPEVTLTTSGLQYEVIESGPAAAPSPDEDDWACVHYTGTLIDGTVFDSTDGGLPIVLPLAGIIEGWREALPLMAEGDRWTLYIPPELGYGPTGAAGVIPPNAALVFDIALLRVLEQSEIAVLADRRVDPEWNCAEEMPAAE